MLVDILDGLLQLGERAAAVDRKGLEFLQPRNWKSWSSPAEISSVRLSRLSASLRIESAAWPISPLAVGAAGEVFAARP